MTAQGIAHPESLDPNPGAAIYAPWSLRLYDALVLGFSGRYVWRCGKDEVLALYNQHASARHLDVGVGTVYFLDNCLFPVPNPTIALLDLNSESLKFTASRIRRYHPTVYQASVLDPLSVDLSPFGSVAMSYLLHCLPGDMTSKARAFEQLQPLVAPGGVVFGATILGTGITPNPLAAALQRLYNWRGIMTNRNDSAEGLEAALKKSFPHVTVDVSGCVALFVAKAD